MEEEFSIAEAVRKEIEKNPKLKEDGVGLLHKVWKKQGFTHNLREMRKFANPETVLREMRRTRKDGTVERF